MDAILHVLLSWQFILISSAILFTMGTITLVILIRKQASILTGVSQLLQSPSGLFALLALAAITFVTYKQPTVGGTAFAAFVAVVPAILSWAEHKETVLQMNQYPVPLPVNVPVLAPSVPTDPPPPPPDAPPPPVVTLTANLPPRGMM
jgi:hypothetical protein